MRRLGFAFTLVSSLVLLAIPAYVEANTVSRRTLPTATGRTWAVSRLAPAPGPQSFRQPRGLVLKLKATAATCLSCALARGEALGELVPGSRLDALNRRFGAHAARPLLAAHARKLIPESHTDTLRRSAAVAARFFTREQRASAGAVIPDFSRIYILDVRRRLDLDRIARVYAADPAVEYCEPDYIVEAAFTPDDPYFSSSNSWGQQYDDLWGVKKIQAPAAWDTTRGAGVTVAVVDTGIDYTHPDIAANVWTNPGEIPNNGIDEDGNGYVDDVQGWNFVAGTNDPMDDHFHGTHVAGTIAAVGNNGIGVVGVAFESHVMAVKALDQYGYGAVSDLAQAILYAVDNGADVVNASWGGTGHSQLISDAIAYAHAHGVVFVAAAGNSAADTSGMFPANDPNAITVAATTHLDQAASFSNFGVKLDVAAPGGGDGPPPADSKAPAYSVLSLLSSQAQALWTLPSGVTVDTNYLRLAGTSMAAPHVSGAAALVLAEHPEFSVEQVRQALRSTADDLGSPGPDPTFGYGRLNAANAVAAPTPLIAHLTSPVAQTLVGQTAVPITGSAGGPGFASYTVEYGPAPTPTVWTPIAGPVSASVSDGTLTDWDLSAVPDGDYVIQLRVDGTAEYIDRAPVTIRNVIIDTPAPAAALRNDAPIEIRGTAAGAGFVSYLVEYRRPSQSRTLWSTDNLTPTMPVTAPVRNGVLATLDASGLTAGERFDFRLTVINGAGSNEWHRSGVVIDPSLHPGWPQPLVPVADREYLTVADLDGDGKKEILVGSGDEVVVFEPDGSVRPGWPQSVADRNNPFAQTQGSPLVADVAGDTAPEVIATDRHRLFVWSADGVLLPGFPRTVNAFFGMNAWITAADLDGDGKDEILCGGVGPSAAFRGDATELPGWNITGDMPFAAGDAFGNGLTDIARYAELVWNHRLSLIEPGHNGLSGWPRRVRAGFFTHVGMADLDGDGGVDPIVLQENMRNNRVKVHAFNAAGQRIPMTTYNSRPPPNSTVNRYYSTNGLLSFADLDHDGRAEAYLYATIGNKVPGLQFGRFVRFTARGATPLIQPPVHQVLTTSWLYLGGVAIGDIDGDGAQELVAGVAGSNAAERVAVVAARADGSLVSQFPKPIPEVIVENGQYPVIAISGYVDDPRYATPAIADLEGDGLKEVLWVDVDTNLLMVWDVAGTPAPEVADWPMYHHDPKHTNVLPVVR